MLIERSIERTTERKERGDFSLCHDGLVQSRAAGRDFFGAGLQPFIGQQKYATAGCTGLEVD